MNETISTILSRRSIRSYTKEPVSREALEVIVQCGQYAATAIGRQPWHFTVVTDRQLLTRISNACGDPENDNFRGAPCAIIVSAEIENELFGDIDCANATENMALAAKSLNLGSCYIASFRRAFESPERNELMKALAIPEGFRPTLALAVGHTLEEPTERAPRRENTVNWID